MWVNRKTRVLVLTPDFPPSHGGIQRLMHRLVNTWQTLCTLVVTRRTAEPGRRESLALVNARAVAAGLRFRPDVVLCGHIALAPAACAIRRMTDVPYVQYVFGQEIADRPRLSRFAVRQAAAVIAISRYTESLVARWTDSGALHRIYPGVDFPGCRRTDLSERPLIVTVSRLAERYKGHDVMLRALPLVRAAFPDVCWVVIGDGPLRPIYERMAWTLNINDHVRFLGAVGDRERDMWLDLARLFAMPSRLSPTGGGEGFGIAYLEAGTHRLPVVAGGVGGTVDAVVHGITGLLVDPADHTAVAQAITELLSDRSLADALGHAGEVRAQQFSWSEVAARVEHVLREVVLAQAA